MPLTFLQTEQTQIRQLLQELPDQGLLCLLMAICLHVYDSMLVYLARHFFYPMYKHESLYILLFMVGGADINLAL